MEPFRRAMYPYFAQMGWYYRYEYEMSKKELEDMQNEYARRISQIVSTDREQMIMDTKRAAWEAFREFRDRRQLGNSNAIKEAEHTIETKSKDMLTLAKVEFYGDDSDSDDSGETM